MKALVTVLPKASVLDPQGVAVKNAMLSLGFSGASGVRLGKIIEIHLDTQPDAAQTAQLHGICRDLLSNPVIEDYQLEILPE